MTGKQEVIDHEKKRASNLFGNEKRIVRNEALKKGSQRNSERAKGAVLDLRARLGRTTKITGAMTVANADINKKVVEPILDFEAMPLKKGQRPPKGWKVGRTTAAHHPPGWPVGKPYHCQCGCGHTTTIGGRFAYRNLMVVGLVEEGYYDAKTEAPKKKPRYFKTPILIDTKRTRKSRASASGSRTSPTTRKRR
jgi:hypothetical protein